MVPPKSPPVNIGGETAPAARRREPYLWSSTAADCMAPDTLTCCSFGAGG
jgi:hypothetical protein